MSNETGKLYITKFGAPTNGDNTVDSWQRLELNATVNPWCSATPLMGELMQESLDALLENDLRLASSVPDCSLKNGKSDKIPKNPLSDLETAAAANLVGLTDIKYWTTGANDNLTTAVVATPNGGEDDTPYALGMLVPPSLLVDGSNKKNKLLACENGALVWKDFDTKTPTVNSIVIGTNTTPPATAMSLLNDTVKVMSGSKQVGLGDLINQVIKEVTNK